MDLQLAGRRALVTGSSAGIGRGVALGLAREGAEGVVHGRNRERVEETAAAVRAEGATAHVSIGDLATDAGAASVVQAAGEIDILVNNVGGLEATGGAKPSWFDVRPEEWGGGLQKNPLPPVRMGHH